MTAAAAQRRPDRSETGDPPPLTPGPLTTSKSVRQAMVHDRGSRDAAFIALHRQRMERVPKIAHGEGRYVTAPTQADDMRGALEAVRETLIEMNGDLAGAR
ncbi:hypothetical protein [Roseiarcus sp.]|uniref:hypothetical protein n=1 Tax=Roseiarcus sp. TaxID=1969460 RepID=UPI003F9BA7CE